MISLVFIVTPTTWQLFQLQKTTEDSSHSSFYIMHIYNMETTNSTYNIHTQFLSYMEQYVRCE